MPSVKSEIRGSFDAAKLRIKQTVTRPAIILSYRAGGMITARNIPKRATLSALTI